LVEKCLGFVFFSSLFSPRRQKVNMSVCVINKGEMKGRLALFCSILAEYVQMVMEVFLSSTVQNF